MRGEVSQLGRKEASCGGGGFLAQKEKAGKSSH